MRQEHIQGEVQQRPGAFRQWTTAIVDNDPLALKVLSSLLVRLLPSLKLIWRTTRGTEALDLCCDPDTEPQILFLDMSLNEKNLDGLHICRLLRSRHSKTAVIGITSFPLDNYAEKLAAEGAQAIVTKSSISMIRDAFQAVCHGKTFTPIDEIRFYTVSEANQKADQNERVKRNKKEANARLTHLEQAVLHHLSNGDNYQTIAVAMNKTPEAVRMLSFRAVRALQAKSLNQAIAIWVKNNEEQ